MRLWLALFLIFFWGGRGVAHAQVVHPLERLDLPAAALFQKTGPKPLANGNGLALPFFDDFSQGEGAPDARRWLPSGGVLASNRFADSPPSIYAAMFDGLNAQGLPYGAANAVGPTDTLTSQPLALGASLAQDSLYLSFYWQAGGLIDAPDFSSAYQFYLELQFKDANGTWNTVWFQKGNGRNTAFAPVMVALKDSKYLYDGFQFRWVSSGSQNGLRDVWHLDYVFLDKNRRLNQLQTLDVALTHRLPSLLRRYTAMPLWQFLVNPAQEVNPAVGAALVNRSPFPAAVGWRAFAQNLSTSAVDTFLKGSAPVVAGASTNLLASPSSSFMASQQQPYSLQTVLFLNTKEPNFFTRYNDTLRRQTHLQDFYAYDDGSAESGVGFPSGTALQLAYQYELNTPDRLKEVRIFFSAANTPGTELYLRIWSDDNGRPTEQPLHEQKFTVPSANSLNAWLNIPLSQQVPVQGKFYIGYRQPMGDIFVNVGFDVNERAEGKLFTLNGAANWAPVQNLDGTLMLRPVMAGTLTAAKAEENLPVQPVLYPNPVTAQVFYLSQPFDQVQLFSMTGQLVQTWGRVSGKEPLLVAKGLAAGIYVVKALKGTELTTFKLILAK